MGIQRENTLTLDFKNVTKKPQNVRLHKWIKETFQFNIDQLLCIQFDHIRNKVYIKLISKVLVQTTLVKFQDGVFYKDEEDNEYEIYIGEEVNETIIKIFDFPIEMDNGKIKEKLKDYGEVKSIRNEKWNGDGMYNCESGVRIVTMHIKKNVPSYLRIDGSVSLVTYRDQIRTCMKCDEPGHVRRDCPKSIENRIKEIRRPAAPLIIEEPAAEPVIIENRLETNRIDQKGEKQREEVKIIEERTYARVLSPSERNQSWYNETMQQQEPEEREKLMEISETSESEIFPNQEHEKRRKGHKKRIHETSSSDGEKKVPAIKISLRNKVLRRENEESSEINDVDQFY